VASRVNSVSGLRCGRLGCTGILAFTLLVWLGCVSAVYNEDIIGLALAIRIWWLQSVSVLLYCVCWYCCSNTRRRSKTSFGVRAIEEDNLSVKYIDDVLDGRAIDR
jgi:hypothetical protein